MSEKQKRTEEWIKIYTPEGKALIASPEYVRKLLGISKDKLNLIVSLDVLKRRMDRLESPGRQEEILRLLGEHGKHNRIWIKNRVINYQWYDIGDLILKGLIVESRSGSVYMYSCAVEK